MAIRDPDPLSTGIFAVRRQAQLPATPAPVELVGHVTFVERSTPTNLDGMRALLKLRDAPGTTVVVVTTQLRLQALLESALSSGNRIACLGTRLADPLAARGRARTTDLYTIDGAILYSSP